MKKSAILFSALFLFLFLQSCKTCKTCTCPNADPFEICEKDAASKTDYDQAIEFLEKTGCTCSESE